MAYQDLGKLVKQKYPGAYDNVPDDQLGMQVSKKYPGAYDSVIGSSPIATPPPTDTPVTGGGGVMGFLKGVVAPAADALTQNIDALKGTAVGHALGQQSVSDILKGETHVTGTPQADIQKQQQSQKEAILGKQLTPLQEAGAFGQEALNLALPFSSDIAKGVGAVATKVAPDAVKGLIAAGDALSKSGKAGQVIKYLATKGVTNASIGAAYGATNQAQAGGSVSDIIKSMPINAASMVTLGGVFDGILPLISNIAKSGANWLTSGSELADVPKGVQIKQQAMTTFNKMMDYGINTIQGASDMADKVTGNTGVLTKMTRDAVGQVGSIDTVGLQDALNQEMGFRVTPDQKMIASLGKEDRKLYNLVDGLLTSTSESVGPTGRKIVVNGQINSTAAFDAVRQLEAKKAFFGGQAMRSGNPDSATLADSYGKMATFLKNKIYGLTDQVGTDSGTVLQDLKTKYASQISELPKALQQDIMNAGSLAELRSLAAPFVRASNIYDAVGQVGEASKGNPNIMNLLFGKGKIPGMLLGAAETGITKGVSGTLRGASSVVRAVANPALQYLTKLGFSKAVNNPGQ